MNLAAIAPVLLAVLLPVAGCGPGGTAAPAPAPDVATVTAEPPPDRASQASRSPSATAQSTPETGGASGEKVQTGVVPNVVGMDHQLAQDTMQAAGFHNLAEEDATGAGRPLLVDRNWVVVSQAPRPGVRVNKGAAVVLKSKKKTDR